MVTQPGAHGYLIAVTGIPSVGKSTVSRAVADRSSTFRHFDGDEFIRRTPEARRLAGAQRILASMLDEIEKWMTSSNVVLDVTLPASYVARTQERFGSSVMVVSLLMDKDEWRRRDSQRPDRGPLQWSAALTALQGPGDLYDLVIDTTRTTPDGCAETIVSKAQELWPDIHV